MTCRDFIDFLWRYLHEELTPEERFTFDAHLAVCPHCVEYLASYRATLDLEREALRAAEEPVPGDIPEDLLRAVLAARKV